MLTGGEVDRIQFLSTEAPSRGPRSSDERCQAARSGGRTSPRRRARLSAGGPSVVSCTGTPVHPRSADARRVKMLPSAVQSTVASCARHRSAQDYSTSSSRDVKFLEKVWAAVGFRVRNVRPAPYGVPMTTAAVLPDPGRGTASPPACGPAGGARAACDLVAVARAAVAEALAAGGGHGRSRSWSPTCARRWRCGPRSMRCY